MKSYQAGLALLLTIAATCSLSATTVAIDYFTGFTTPTQVITSDQPLAAIAGDPGSGVTFSNPHFFHNTSLENYNPFTQGFGGSVGVSLPGLADSFGLFAGANSSGDFFHLDFYLDAVLVGYADFLLPSGQPGATIAAAFYSDVAFNNVVLSAPSNGFMRIDQDSIKFQSVAASSAPDSLNMLPVVALVLAGLVGLRRRLA